MIYGYFTLCVALVISAIAEYYSIIGLTSIFSAAFWPVVIMGAALGVGKLTAAVWLKLNWERASWAYKLYLVPAVAFLMMLTSLGCFGYLSKAHSDQSLVSGDSMAKVAIYDEKIKIAKDNIDANRKALKQMDEAVDQVMGRSSDEKGADKAVGVRRSQQKERARLLAEIQAEQKTITALSEEAAPLRAEFRKVEAEVGPIKYIAALVYGDNPDANILERAVRLVIILIVAVFDPLALVLILAAQQSLRWAREEKENAKYEPDDGLLTTDQINQLQNIEPAPAPEEEPTDPSPPGWMFDISKHQYLNIPWVGFSGFKPMPAPPEHPVEEPTEWEEASVEEQSTVEEQPETDLSVYDDERLVSKYDKMDLERPGDYLTPPEEDPEKEAKRLWKNEHPETTLKEQRRLYETGQIPRLPWEDLLAPQADNAATPIAQLRGFGITFPTDAIKGDTFIRVDQLPSALYKFNGLKWIEVDKNLSDQYAYDVAYIDHLIEKIASGEYDPELLSDAESEQVAQRLQQQTKGT